LWFSTILTDARKTKSGTAYRLLDGILLFRLK
jgi:hypothetical protein